MHLNNFKRLKMSHTYVSISIISPALDLSPLKDFQKYSTCRACHGSVHAANEKKMESSRTRHT